MDINFLNELISPVALGIALVIGFLIKNCIRSETINRYIPIICAVIGLVVMTIVDLTQGTFSITTILCGLISGLAATGLFEAFRNLFNIPESHEDPSAYQVNIIESDEEK